MLNQHITKLANLTNRHKNTINSFATCYISLYRDYAIFPRNKSYINSVILVR